MSVTMSKYSELLKLAAERNYSVAAFEAAQEYIKRTDRMKNPPGEFDKAGRFYASERTKKVESVRSPSRNFPWPEMKAARTAEHCAEVAGVPALHVKRLAKAIRLQENVVTIHDQIECLRQQMIILKPVKRTT